MKQTSRCPKKRDYHANKSVKKPIKNVRITAITYQKREKIQKYDMFIEKTHRIFTNNVLKNIYNGNESVYRIFINGVDARNDTSYKDYVQYAENVFMEFDTETDRIKNRLYEIHKDDIIIPSIPRNPCHITFNMLTKNTHAHRHEFIRFFDDYDAFLSKTYNNIRNDIKNSLFTNKIKKNVINRECIPDIIRFYETVYDYTSYTTCDHTKDEIILYRAISDNNDTCYFPSLFKVGDIINQYMPFSTSMQAEFPFYAWTFPYQHSYILKIIVKNGIFNKGIPISKYSINQLIKSIYKLYSTSYQSEITLLPGTFKVISIDPIDVVNLSQYKHHLSSILHNLEQDNDVQDSIYTLGDVVCDPLYNPHSLSDKNFTKTCITVEYSPYSIDEIYKIIYFMNVSWLS